MLKVKGMREVSPGKRLFVVEDEGEPASMESLDRVAVVARRLLEENGLAGEFQVFEKGLLALDLRAGDRTFFHDGIVFAALDAVNDPDRNPTLTRIATAASDSAGQQELRAGHDEDDRKNAAQGERHETSRSEPRAE